MLTSQLQLAWQQAGVADDEGFSRGLPHQQPVEHNALLQDLQAWTLSQTTSSATPALYAKTTEADPLAHSQQAHSTILCDLPLWQMHKADLATRCQGSRRCDLLLFALGARLAGSGGRRRLWLGSHRSGPRRRRGRL